MRQQNIYLWQDQIAQSRRRIVELSVHIKRLYTGLVSEKGAYYAEQFLQVPAHAILQNEIQEDMPFLTDAEKNIAPSVVSFNIAIPKKCPQDIIAQISLYLQELRQERMYISRAEAALSQLEHSFGLSESIVEANESFLLSFFVIAKELNKTPLHTVGTITLVDAQAIVNHEQRALQGVEQATKLARAVIK